MSEPNLLKWSEFAPELKEFNTKLLQNGYDDTALLLLDPYKQEEWTEFLSANEILPGTKLKFRDKIVAFREQNQDKVQAENGKKVKVAKKNDSLRGKSVQKQIEVIKDTSIKEKRITPAQDSSNFNYQVVFKDSMLTKVSECKEIIKTNLHIH